jgi:hypothetical protein
MIYDWSTWYEYRQSEMIHASRNTTLWQHLLNWVRMPDKLELKQM